MERLIDEIPRKEKVEIEKCWTKVILEFLGWVWDKEKWVSLTGSATKMTIMKPNSEKIVWLIDFGMFQWCENELKYNEILPFDLEEIDFVLLTHTHLDHLWKLLHFSKDEFKWTIWTTKLNRDILFSMLSDVIKLQPEVKNNVEKLKTKKENYLSLLDKISAFWKEALEQFNGELKNLDKEIANAEKDENNNKKQYFEIKDLLKLTQKVNWINYLEKFEVVNDILATTISAWHLPWSAQFILKIKVEKDKEIKIWFSGDIWKFQNSAVWWKPEISREKLDLFVIEWTYSDRLHSDFLEEEKKLVNVINETIQRNWNIIIPTFVQWRSQEAALYLTNLMDSWKISKVPIFYHSALIEKITETYSRYYPKIFASLLKNQNIKKAFTGKWKNKQNHFEKYKKSSIILASWWMMNWWSIENYLDYLEDPKNLFLAVWYQAEKTLWNKIFTQKVSEIEHKEKWKININCQIHNFKWFSGHWDQNDLLALLWNMKFEENAKIVINHSEKSIEQFWFIQKIKEKIEKNSKEILWKINIILADFNEKYYK